MIGHLGHFLLDFFGQIWTEGTLRHILGSVMVIFEICHFLMIPVLFDYFFRKWMHSEVKVFSMKEWLGSQMSYQLSI